MRSIRRKFFEADDICPYCEGDGCEECGFTGENLSSEAKEKNNEEGIEEEGEEF